jgi:AcrR family transcriptional regulator
MTIDPSGREVKRRRYDSSSRRERARSTRATVLEVASRLFLRDGVDATTVGAIAHEAAVSVDTVYKTFGGKVGLLRALCHRALEGVGEIPAETRSDALQDSEADGAKLLQGLGSLTAEVAPRVAPILLLLPQGAASDLGALRAELDSQRRERMLTVATKLASNAHLRRDLAVDEAADILWSYSSPELFGLLVLTRGWTPERYGRFIGDALTAALLVPERDPLRR